MMSPNKRATFAWIHLVDFTNPIIAQKWDEVVFRINAGEMPPEDEKQPSATEIGNLADNLVEKIREGSAARMAKEEKYNNTA